MQDYKLLKDDEADEDDQTGSPGDKKKPSASIWKLLALAKEEVLVRVQPVLCRCSCLRSIAIMSGSSQHYACALSQLQLITRCQNMHDGYISSVTVPCQTKADKSQALHNPGA